MNVNVMSSQKLSTSTSMNATDLAIPIDKLLDIIPCTDQQSGVTVACRLVTTHPQRPQASVETVWEIGTSAAAAADTGDYDRRYGYQPNQRIAVYSGPETSPRVCHASFLLPADADPNHSQRPMAWTTFPGHPDRFILCVLLHATNVCLWDVYPFSDRCNDDDDEEEEGRENNNTNHRSTSRPTHQLSLPAEGWTITLPFDCCAILSLPGRGLLLQRLQHADENDDGFFLQSPPTVTNTTTVNHTNDVPFFDPDPAIPALFTLDHPLQDVVPVAVRQPLTSSSSSSSNAATVPSASTTAPQLTESSFTLQPMADAYETLIWAGTVQWVEEDEEEECPPAHAAIPVPPTSHTPQLLLVTHHTIHQQHAVWLVHDVPVNSTGRGEGTGTNRYNDPKINTIDHGNAPGTLAGKDMTVLMEDLDLLGYSTGQTTTNAMEISRQEALADALGLPGSRKTPRTGLPQPVPNFLSPRSLPAAPVPTTTRTATGAIAVDAPSPMEKAVTPIEDGPFAPIRASRMLQLLYRESQCTSPAQSVFVISNPTATGTLVLCFKCPRKGTSSKTLRFLSLQPHPKKILHISHRTEHDQTMTCRDAVPLTSSGDPEERSRGSSTLGATDLLVLTMDYNIILCRAWHQLASCSPAVTDHVMEFADPIQDRVTLITASKQQIRCQLSLGHRNDALTESILQQLDYCNMSPMISLRIRADVYRRGRNSWSALCGVIGQIALHEWNIKPAPRSFQTTKNAWEQMQNTYKSQRYEQAVWNLDHKDEPSSPIPVLFIDSSIPSMTVEYMARNCVSGVTTCLFDHLHLLYEDMKINSRKQNHRMQLGVFLVQLCHLYPIPNDPLTMRFLDHYGLDFGETMTKVSRPMEVNVSLKVDPISSLPLDAKVPSIMGWYEQLMQGKAAGRFGFPEYPSYCRHTISTCLILSRLFTSYPNQDVAVVQALLAEGYRDMSEIREILPASMSLPILDSLSRSRNFSKMPHWSAREWSLVGRDDLSKILTTSRNDVRVPVDEGPTTEKLDEKAFTDTYNDGLLPLEKTSALLFPDDNRVHEAARLLRSSRPMFLRVTRPVELSDHDYERLKQKKLLSLSYRSLSLPIGRGMLTIGSLNPVPAEPLPLPEICLKGRVPPTNASMTLDMTECPADTRVWPEFHNGVAAGLRLPQEDLTAKGFSISRTWIVYNKPPSFHEPAIDGEANIELLSKNHTHGGLLLALGLRGHLTALEMSDLYDYLTQGTVTTTVGILLGMAANKRGTCDIAVSKMLFLHIPSLIPQHFSAIDVASSVQSAAVVGAGLLFQRSSHRMMTEFLLNEIGKRPDSDAGAFDRESYSLACGLSLGMINLCLSDPTKGIDRVAGLADLGIEARLLKYILGGIDRDEQARTRESNDRFSMPSLPAHGDNEKCSTIHEGDLINTDVTAPGATLALGLIYMKSGNQMIASLLDIPDTHFLLELVRPDLLTLRIISRSLILWDEINPTIEWIEAQVPVVIRTAYSQMGELAKKATEGHVPKSKDRRLMDYDRRATRQIYVHTIAGACFGMGLRFAGTGAREPAEAIKFFVLELYALRESKDPVALACKPELPILETALGCAAISLAMVMAGSGDLDALRILKMIRWRHEDTSFGFHMICGMAIGLLFLGGGTCTLGREPEDIAAMVTAFFPRFPLSTSDNQCHLQALRHIYAVAVKKRDLRAVDVESGRNVQVSIELLSLGLDTRETITLPCLLRNSDTQRQELRVVSKDYYPLQVGLDRVMHHGILYVKRRNFLSAQTMTMGEISLPAHPGVLFPWRELLLSSPGMARTDHQNTLCVLLDRIAQNHLEELLPVYLSLSRNPISPDHIWNLRLIMGYFQSSSRWGGNQPQPPTMIEQSRRSAMETLLLYLLTRAEQHLMFGKEPLQLARIYYHNV